MASFDIVSRIDLQEVDNAVNITKKTILSRYDFRESKTRDHPRQEGKEDSRYHRRRYEDESGTGRAH